MKAKVFVKTTERVIEIHTDDEKIIREYYIKHGKELWCRVFVYSTKGVSEDNDYITDIELDTFDFDYFIELEAEDVVKSLKDEDYDVEVVRP